MEKLTIPVNTNVPKYTLRQVVNPGQNRNCYDSKIIENFDADDFKAYVEDHLNAKEQIVGGKYELLHKIFPVQFKPIEQLRDGSGCNDDEHFSEHETWRAALYDIWEDVMAYSGV